MRGIRARPCASVYDAACVHGHEDLGSKRSRGPSGSDPSTPARIRHTRTPMLRGRARRCLGGVPGLYPAGLRLRPPPPPPFPPLRSSSHRLSSFSVLSRSPVSPLRLFLFLPVPPVLILRSPSSPPSPLPLFCLLFFGAARIHVHPRN